MPYAGRGSDSDSTRRPLRWLGTEPGIARRRTEHGSGPGSARWVAERSMRVRCDRLGVTRDASTTPAVGVSCFRILNDGVL